MPSCATMMGVSVLYIIIRPRSETQRGFGFDGDWDQWLALWLSGEVEFGSWFDHTLGWWKAFCDPVNTGRILWVTYEQLHTARRATIERLAEFIGAVLNLKARSPPPPPRSLRCSAAAAAAFFFSVFLSPRAK